MSFLDYLKSQTEFFEKDLIIGDVDMPATFCHDPESEEISDRAIEVFGEILNSEFEEIDENVIEIFSDNYKLGERFVLAKAGYIGIAEYNEYFPEIEKTFELER